MRQKHCEVTKALLFNAKHRSCEQFVRDPLHQHVPSLLRQSSYRDSSDDPLTMLPLVVGVSCLNLLLVQQTWKLQINVCFHAEWEGRFHQGGSLTCSMIFFHFCSTISINSYKSKPNMIE